MAELYKAMPNSPVTTLSSQISATQDIIPVTDLSKLPDAPNLATIGFGEKSETIRYTSKSNGALRGVTRGFEGIAQKWPAGTEIARFFTAYDYNEVIKRIITINENIATIPELFEWTRTKATLQNGWTGDLYYGKNDILRLVYLEGVIHAGDTSAGTIVTSIPESFAPSSSYAFPVYSESRGRVYLGIYVATDGLMRVRAPAAGAELGSIQINGLWRI